MRPYRFIKIHPTHIEANGASHERFKFSLPTRLTFLLLLLFLCLSARGATVNVWLTNFDNTLSTNDAIVSRITERDFEGSYSIIGLPVRKHSTNGLATFSLLQGDYQLQVYGQTWRSNLIFAVPSGIGTYDVQSLWVSGGNIFNYAPPFDTVTVHLSTNKLTTPFGAVDISRSRTAGIQEAIDSLSRATNISSIVGGGRVVIAPGLFVLQTNVATPSEFPFSLDLEGTFLGTRLRLQGSTNKAQFFCTTNYTGFPLTNSLQLHVHGIQFESEAIYPTNFIWTVDGQNWAEFDHNIFISAYALTNGNGQLTKNFEGNMPNAPCGLGGIAVNYFASSAANATFYCHDNWFYGMAISIADGAVISRIYNNYFSCISVMQPNPAIVSPSAYATNLWRGNISGGGFTQGAGAISAGAALVFLPSGGNSTFVVNNEFFNCGAVATVDPGGSSADPVVFLNNRMSGVKYRVLARDTGAEQIGGWYWESISPSSGEIVTGVPTDSIITNTATVAQPNGSSAFTYIGPVTKISHVGFQPGNGDDSYVDLNGAFWSGNGSGLTNANATLLFGSGTMPPQYRANGTGGQTWSTNSTLPNNTTTIRSWLTITNQSGKVCKIPVYE